MKIANLTVSLLVLMSSLFVTLLVLPEGTTATVLYVGGAGTGNYTTIQGAIDAASLGDTVYVFGGTYSENVEIDKTLSLVGEGRHATTVEGQGTGGVVEISAHWVNLTGFTLKGNWAYGVKLAFAENCSIFGNSISSSVRSIHMWYSHNNTLADNFHSNNIIGVYTDSSNHNLITNSTFTGNALGIYLHHSNWNNLTSNELSSLNGVFSFEYGGDGIELEYSDNNTVAHNRMFHHSVGVKLKLSHKNVIRNNNIFWSSSRGLSLHGSEDNRIFHNNFVENEEHAWDDSHSNQYDNGYPSGGNYWDDYEGVDEKNGPDQDQPGSDGVGDSPYDIQVGTGLDRYPMTRHLEPFDFPIDTPSEDVSILEQTWFWMLIVCTMVVVAILIIIARRRMATGRGGDGGNGS